MKKKKVKFKTYDQLLDNLRDHGLTITNNGLAIEMLKSRGYYNLVNRYKNSLYEKNKNQYRPNSSLTEMYQYSRMEDDLKNILFRFTINFEQEVKENMSYIMAKNFGVNQKSYLDPHNYRSRHYKRTVSIISQIYNVSTDSENNPTKYYRDNYECIPPWILLNNLMFGEMRMLYSIFPNKMKRYVVRQLLLPSPKDELSYDNFTMRAFSKKDQDIINKEERELQKWPVPSYIKATIKAENDVIELFQTILKTINAFRNTLAHGGSIANFHAYQNLNLKYIKYFISNGFTDSEFKNKNLGNGIFGVFVCLLLTLDKYDALFLIQKLKDWKKQNTENVDQQRMFINFVRFCNLPDDFIERLEKIRRDLYFVPRIDAPDIFKFY